MKRILADHPGMQYLLFRLALEDFGVPVANVEEILRMQKITAVPRTAPYWKGVMNLRGKIIPVMDLRVKFGFGSAEQDNQCIVVAQVENMQVGMIVDSVSEVLNIDPAGTEDCGRTLLDVNEVLGTSA